MYVSTRAFWCPKRGCDPRDYEDAFRPRLPIEGRRCRVFRCAVSDGATEASFAAQWARLLAGGYVRGGLATGGGHPLLASLRRRWAEHVRTLVLPWYASEKAERGAFATLLGLTLVSSGSGQRGKWMGAAVGDSCLFHLRRRGRRAKRLERVVAFPITDPTRFGSSPALIGSVEVPGGLATPALECRWGAWRAEDVFLLCTDALAEWALREEQSGGHPWEALLDLGSERTPSFEAWIDELRTEGRLRNDDVTIVRVDLDA